MVNTMFDYDSEIPVTVHTYCKHCDMIIETNTSMDVLEFSELQEDDPETYEIVDDEYFIRQDKICSKHTFEDRIDKIVKKVFEYPGEPYNTKFSELLIGDVMGVVCSELTDAVGFGLTKTICESVRKHYGIPEHD